MAVMETVPTVILLKMVRSERTEEVAGLVGALARRFPDAHLVWATTPAGVAALSDPRIPSEWQARCETMAIAPGGLPLLGLVRAVRALRRVRPRVCVIGYDTPGRLGNVALETLALLSAAPETHWLADADSLARISRSGLVLRVSAGLALAAGLTVGGLLVGLVAGGVLAASRVLPRRAMRPLMPATGGPASLRSDD